MCTNKSNKMISTKNKGLSFSQETLELKKYIKLCNAVENNRFIEAYILILKSDTNLNHTTQLCCTPLHYAVKNDDIKIAALLLDKGAKIDARDADEKTPLHYAVKNYNIKSVALLLDKGAKIDARDAAEKTPLHYVVGSGHIEIAAMLLERGAKIDARDALERTPLHYAFQIGRIEIPAMLLDRGAKIDARDAYEKTPLHCAAFFGRRDIAVMLLERGAKIDARQRSGYTPLHTAVHGGCFKIVELLLQKGATIDAKNILGRTPLYNAIFASSGRDTRIVTALLDYGADINLVNTEQIIANHDYFCSNIIKQHIVKMKTAKMYLTKEHLQSVTDQNELKNFQNSCEEEIERMKYDKIGNSTVSYYNMLTKSVNLIAMWTKNVNIVEVLKFGEYKWKYPAYASMINRNFRKGVERKELLEQSNKLFCSLSKNLPELTYNCIDKIFSYLNNKDLQNFIIK